MFGAPPLGLRGEFPKCLGAY